MPAITDVPGIAVGHATDQAALTGCTVVLAEAGAVGGVDVRGSAPGTRETDLLRPMNLVQRVHAVLLTGGSAFGLGAAEGVMRYLEERDVGFDTGVEGAPRVPIVPAAVLFDLRIGDRRARPTPQMAYEACWRASTVVEEGSVGAGTGATVGKVFGVEWAMKGGVGTWSVAVSGGAVVGALVVVNAFGDVVDDRTGRILAGARDPGGAGFVDTAKTLQQMELPPGRGIGEHTTLAVVATTARLSKEATNWLARVAHDGLARVISPVHTLYDGDTVFALSLGEAPSHLLSLGTAAVEAVAEAVKRAVRLARGAGGVPGLAG
ncbi:MAG: P1 family peptidase [Armatimonadota bacterium]|nr:P1 family peptidase [Armatimonadota bacterium]MDR7451619.1 P1 family peptidase [Armatimonadota bacterium]MDR7467661.1 P1 family peptidase [Armatimonadota bacterium]MDR7492588.1 P1 family peptidase [Armatimonadota bacterium]MDR7499944.1 P1 family peptidase [Armatimonadota bacterium]